MNKNIQKNTLIGFLNNSSFSDTKDNQSDWLENNTNKNSFIKNRPFYEETVEVDYLSLPMEDYDEESDMGIINRRIGLNIGDFYTVEFFKDGELKNTEELECVDFSAIKEIEIGTIPTLFNDYFSFADGININEEGNPVLSDSSVYSLNLSIIDNVKIYGIKNLEDRIIKIPNKFLSIDNAFDGNSKNAQSGIAIDRVLKEEKKVIKEEINNLSIEGNKIVDGTITKEKIKNYTITGDKIALNTISESSLRVGSISGDKIKNNSITGDKIINRTITEDKIAGTINGDKISSSSILERKLEPFQLISSLNLNNSDEEIFFFGCTNNQYRKILVNGTICFGESEGSLRPTDGNLQIGVYTKNTLKPTQRKKINTMNLNNYEITKGKSYYITIILEYLPSKTIQTTLTISESKDSNTFVEPFVTNVYFSKNLDPDNSYFMPNGVNGFYIQTKNNVDKFNKLTNFEVWGINGIRNENTTESEQ